MARRYSGYGYWSPYVPVAERRAQAILEVNKLKKMGAKIEPIEIEGRTIARSFWGKGWCKHLEGFGDFSNRLPRGRTYVRNGSVCHLSIEKGKVEAMVSGSSIYHVNVEITPLKKEKWIALKQDCAGKIASLLELLQGKLSQEIMQIVTDCNNGLFPLSGEIHYSCDCLDWASMCKHVSAVMYGIGARLDTQPELLFLLRGVQHEDLISAGADTGSIVGAKSRRARRRSLSKKDIEDVFGVELEGAQKKRTSKVTAAKDKKVKKPFKATAQSITKLRQKLEMNKSEFASAVGVSSATINNWEKSKVPLNLSKKGIAGLNRLYRMQTKKTE